VHSVLNDWKDYTLSNKDILLRLRLSQENYRDPLFIHPPFFVYSSALLSYVGVSLAIVPTLFVLATSICILYIVKNIDLPETLQYSREEIFLWSVQIYLSCPVVMFCSQKVFSFSIYFYILITLIFVYF